MDKYIGSLLDERYEILQIIGVGGMAVVYKAMDHRLNRLVAIKILKDDYLNDSEFRRRFHGESQAVAMMSHPNIVSVYDVSKNDSADYIVMELIDGITLKQYMEQKGGPLSWRETLHFSMQIARALEHAHSRNIIHRDIKPHNVMILKDGSVKVADFGIARVASSQNTLTKEALGSVHYISPEQARGARVDNRTDIYSLGVVMYEMLTGRPPYDGETPVSVAIQHINGTPLPPSLLNSQIPTGLEQITMHAMCADLNIRYGSVSDMLKDMEEFRKNPAILFTFLPAGAAGESAGVRPQVNRQSIVSSGQPTRRPQTDDRRQQMGRAAQTARDYDDDQRDNGNRKVLMWVGLSLVFLALVAIVLLLIKNAEKRTPAPEASPASTEEISAQVEVPEFVGKSWETVKNEKYDGLNLVVSRTFNSEYDFDVIYDQSIPSNSKVDRGTAITLYVSDGVETNTMPDLTDWDVDKAKGYLEALKVTVRLEQEQNNDFEVDHVIRTIPEAGKTISEGHTVTLYICSGKKTVKVPGVVNATEKDARASIEAMNLKVGTVTREYSDTVEKYRVISQSPRAGDSVEEGTKIDLVISDGVAPLLLPNLVGKTKTEAISILDGLKLKYEIKEAEDSHPVDEVIDQSPDPDQEMKAGDTVYLTVSAGPGEDASEPVDPPDPTDPADPEPPGSDNNG